MSFLVRPAISGLVSMDNMISAVQMWRQITVATGLAEQGHASAALIWRAHAELSENRLKARALIHQTRALFSRSLLDRREIRLKAAVEKLGGRNAQKITGRHLFYRDLATGNAAHFGFCKVENLAKIMYMCLCRPKA